MSESSKPHRTRRRPAFSCEDCRRRKTKRDRTHPCKLCGQVNAVCKNPEGAAPLKCQMTPATSLHRTVEPPTSKSIPTTSISLGHFSGSGVCDGDPQQSPQKPWKLSTNPKENTDDSPKVRALLEKVQKLEQLLSEYMPDGMPRKSSSPASIEPRAQLRGTLSKTRFYGQKHWMNSIALVRLIHNSVLY